MRSCLAGFWRDRKGAAAIEFGAVALPFLALVMGSIETSILYFSATAVESAVAESTRVIRTGQINDEDDPEEAFRERLCDTLIFIRCDELLIEVQAYRTYAAAVEDPPDLDPETGQIIPRGIDFGGARDVVVTRTSYRYQIITPLVGTLLSDTPDNSFLIQAVSIIRNEPYDFGSPQ